MYVFLGLVLIAVIALGLSFFIRRKDHRPSAIVIKDNPGLKKGIKEWGS